jgi:hypothetical protein
MRATMFTMATAGPGKLSTMARPRGGEWLADEMASLREPGTDVLVCMLTTSELRELELTEEAAVAEAAGLRFMRFPRTAYFSMQIGADETAPARPVPRQKVAPTLVPVPQKGRSRPHIAGLVVARNRHRQARSKGTLGGDGASSVWC